MAKLFCFSILDLSDGREGGDSLEVEAISDDMSV